MATSLRSSAKGCLTCMSRHLIYTRRNKTNVQKPRPRHWEARVMESISRPIYILEQVHPSERCTRLKVDEENEVNEYEEFIYKRVKKMFQENQMILVCQQLSTRTHDERVAKNLMIDNKMKLESYNNKLIRQAITEMPEFENMRPWIISYNKYVTSPKPLVTEAINLLKKVPHLILLGGFVENQLFSREGLMRYSQLPHIEQLRGELVSVLNMAGGSRTLSLLESHQQTLCRNLGQYIKQKSEEGNKP